MLSCIVTIKSFKEGAYDAAALSAEGAWWTDISTCGIYPPQNSDCTEKETNEYGKKESGGH